MITAKIVSGSGNKSFAGVNDEGFVKTIRAHYPPDVGAKFTIPLRGFLTDSNGSNDMAVNGSVNPVEFSLFADEKFDIYINSMSSIIADAGASLAKFGNLAALTNGVKIDWVTAQFGDIVIHDGIKTNIEFMRLSGGNPSIGTGKDAFKADLTGAGGDAYLPFVDFSDIFGFTWGLLLRKGSTDKFTFTIQDDLTTLDEMNSILFGIKI